MRFDRRHPTLALTSAIALIAVGIPAVVAAVPIAVADAVVVQKDAAATPLNVLANDTAALTDTITAVPVEPSHGAVSIAADGRSVSYAPAAGYAGLDSFSYTVTNDPDGGSTAAVSVRVNAPPVAGDDPASPGCNPVGTFGGSFPIVEDDPGFVFGAGCALTVNDDDADGSIASWQIVTPPGHGSVVWLPGVPGILQYTPATDFSTTAGDQPGGSWQSDSLTYRVTDNDGGVSNLATLRIWLAPVNDAPTFTPGPATVHGTNNHPHHASWASSIAAGPPNEAGQAVQFHRTGLADPSLFSVPPAIGSDGTLSFTPAANAVGLTTATFVLEDDGGLEDWGVPDRAHPADSSAAVTISIVIDADHPPAAHDDPKTLLEDAGQITIDVLANDTDADGDALQIVATTNGAKGTAGTKNAGTLLVYTPAPNANGADSITYTVSDGHGRTASASVALSITSVNDPPTAGDDGVPTPFTVYGGAGPRALAVLANDTTLPDASENLRIVSVTNGSRGTVAITGGGTGLTYAPNAAASGLDSFTYTISDGHGATDVATVHVRVIDDHTPPAVSAPAAAVARIPHRATVRVLLHWTVADDVGIASEELQVSIDGGSWSAVPLRSATVRGTAVTLPAGHVLRFRVRATDVAGHVSAWMTGPPV
ncbi:MAG TPA: Ig-like domain-containing protein [Candidatus Limnocylindrales bacterium]